MKNLIIKISLLLIATASVPAQSATLVFDHVNIIPMDKEQVLYDQRVTVVDDKIFSIEPASSKLKIKADRIVDSRGQFMIPGLSDTHYHQIGYSIEADDLQYKLLIANGITSVLSMGEWKGQDTIAIRNRANKKATLSPFFSTVGPQLEDHNVKTSEDAIKMVQHHKERGYDFIKVHGNIATDAYFTLLDEAEKAGISVVGHTQRDKPFEFALRMASIVHAEDIVMAFSDEANLSVVDMDDNLAKDIAAQVKDSGIYVAPTLSTVAMIQDWTDPQRFEALKTREINKYLPTGDLKWWTGSENDYHKEFFLSDHGLSYMDKVIKGTRTLTAALHQAGVPMLVGSDNFGIQVTGFSFHKEMQHLQNAGVPTYDILRAATVISARFLGRSASAGSINVGKNAEFVILDKNPLTDIQNTQAIAGVMLKGKWFDRSQLDEMLQKVEDANKK
ncbi:MAG: imidazolonepropionase-like amidohydrolase [Arenicella sp.]|jgi:imidazolonepropionase-like amidohydrolase